MEKLKYKLLIADDEYWTREKLRSMVNWEEYQIDFMEPAENGEEVLQRIQEEVPDILITDINMPFVNGVELVKAVKEAYPEIVVFVISGYDEFNYVKETLVAGAINYLLKPVSKIELVGAVSKALEIIGKTEKNRQQVLKEASLIQDRELSLLIEKEQSSFFPSITFDGARGLAGCSVMLIKVHELQKYMEAYHYDMNLLSYSLKRKIKEITGLEDLQIFNYIFRSNEFIIITEAGFVEQRKIAARILELFSKENISPITVAVSGHTYTMESIHNAYIQSVSVLMTRPYSRRSIVIFYNQEEESIRKRVRNHIDQELEMQIKSLLKSGNNKALKKLILGEIGLEKCDKEEWEYLEVKQTIKRVCNFIMDCYLKMDKPELVQEAEGLAEMADKAVERLDVEVLRELLSEMIDSAAEAQTDMPGSIKEVIHEAIEYIDKNYFEELTLSMLAERFCVESSYFSRMFKQETGKNLMLYIAEKRVIQAKELMKNHDISLTEIAFMTGYDDYTYFNKVFKKMTGKSPRDYRSEQK